jgi:hypothetical protein
MEELDKKFGELQTPGSRLLFISLNLKKEGVITEEEHARIKRTFRVTPECQFQGADSKLLMSLLAKEKHYEKGKFYVQTYLEELRRSEFTQ